MDWMENFRKAYRAPTVVQLLGDIDDIVSAEDDKDLRGVVRGMESGLSCVPGQCRDGAHGSAGAASLSTPRSSII